MFNFKRYNVKYIQKKCNFVLLSKSKKYLLWNLKIMSKIV